MRRSVTAHARLKWRSKVKPRSSWLEQHLIEVTPDPVLTRLEGLNDRMVGRVEMFGRMLVIGRVAAAHVTTGEAEAQVDPGFSHFQTVLTALGARGDFLYLIKMRTALCHVHCLSKRVHPC